MASYSVEAVLKATGASQFVNDMQNASKSVERMQQKHQGAFDKMRRVGGQMKTVGKTMSAAITLPLAAMGASIIKTGAQFDDQMSTVQAVTGATGNEMEKLRDKAKDLGKTTRFSASESAEGMEMLARAGFDTTEVMDALPSVLDLASAGAVDLGEAADITSNILSGYSMEASETAKVSDILAQASADSNTDVQGLGESFKYVGPIASSLGISIEDTAASIGVLGDAGIQGGQAGRMLRKGLQDLAAPSSEAASLMDELGLEVFDANGEMKDMPEVIGELENGLDGMSSQQKQAALETLFGANAMSAWSILVDEGKEGLSEFSDELKNSEGAASEMSDTMEDNVSGSFRSLKSAIEGLQLSFYELGSGPLQTLIEKFTGLIRWIDNTSDTTKQWMVIIAAVAAALGPLLLVLGTIVAALPSLVAGFKLVGAVMAALTGPVGLIIAGITALVAALVLAYNKSETFREGVHAAFNFIKDIVMTVVDEVVEFVMDIWGGLVDWWEENNELITRVVSNGWENLQTIISAVMDFLVPYIQERWEEIKTVIEVVWETIKTVVEVAVEVIKGVITTFLKVVDGDWTGAWETIKETFSNIWDIIKDYVKKVVDIIKDSIKDKLDESKNNVKNIMDSIKNTFKSIWDSIKSLVTTVVNSVKSVVTSVWNAIKSTTSSVFNSVKSVVTTVWNSIKSVVTSAVNSVKSIVTSVWNSIKSTVSSVTNSIKSAVRTGFNALKGIARSAFNGVKNAVKSGMDKALNVVTNIVGKFKTAGRNIVTSIADGIRGAVNKVTSAMKGVVDKARNMLPFSPAKEGPLKDIHKLNFGGTIAQGINKGKSDVSKAMQNMLEDSNVMGKFEGINNSAKRDLNNQIHSNVNVGKQPIQINIEGDSEWIRAYINDNNSNDTKLGGLVRGY